MSVQPYVDNTVVAVSICVNDICGGVPFNVNTRCSLGVLFHHKWISGSVRALPAPECHGLPTMTVT